ncbi:MAG: response regulator [bacterium]
MDKTILIIEDDAFIVNTVVRRFIENKFNMLVAKNWNEAEAILLKTVPDLILLDIILPEVDGF